MRALLTGLAGFVVLASLTGCGTPSGAAGPVPPVGPPKYVATSCPTPTTEPEASTSAEPGTPASGEPGVHAIGPIGGSGGAIPAGFRLAWVLACPVEIQNLPGRGDWWVQLTERADLDPAQASALLAQLRQPSQPPRAGDICTMDLVEPPYYALVDDNGTAIEPAFPRDSCDKPMASVGKALDDLPYRQLSSTPERPVN
jgi:hypothetical protein